MRTGRQHKRKAPHFCGAFAIHMHSFVPSIPMVFPMRRASFRDECDFSLGPRSRDPNRLTGLNILRCSTCLEWIHEQLPLPVPCSCFSRISPCMDYTFTRHTCECVGANVLWQCFSGFSRPFCHLLAHLRELSVSTGSKRITYWSEFIHHRWNYVRIDYIRKFFHTCYPHENTIFAVIFLNGTINIVNSLEYSPNSFVILFTERLRIEMVSMCSILTIECVPIIHEPYRYSERITDNTLYIFR